MAGRRVKQRAKRGRSPETSEQMIDRVLGAFDRWLGERSPDARPDAVLLDIARSACELKSKFVDPNPADWSADVTTHIIGEVMPAKIIGADPGYVEAIVPGMRLYVDFLVQTGRWKPDNDEGSTRVALTRLGDLAPRFGDPARQSMAGRVLQLAADEGVDFSDPLALGEFMQRFNDMPLGWRQRVTDGPDEAGSDPADGSQDQSLDPVGAARDAGIATALATLAGLVSVRPDQGASVTVPAADEEWAALAATRLCARVLELAEWTGPGRAVTGTGAMRLDDARTWCDRWELPVESNRARSMWDVTAIALPWRIGIDCGVIDLDGSKARRGTRPTDGPIADRVRLGRSIVEGLLDIVLVPMDIDKQLLDAINRLMVPMLMSMCTPAGQELDGLDAMPALPPGESDANSYYLRVVAGSVRRNIRMLCDWGVVTETPDRAMIPDALRPSVVQTINSPLAPFRVTLAPGAVPLD